MYLLCLLSKIKGTANSYFYRWVKKHEDPTSRSNLNYHGSASLGIVSVIQFNC